MKFKNINGDIVEYTQEELDNFVKTIQDTTVIKIPTDLNNPNYYFLDEDD